MAGQAFCEKENPKIKKGGREREREGEGEGEVLGILPKSSSNMPIPLEEPLHTCNVQNHLI